MSARDTNTPGTSMPDTSTPDANAAHADGAIREYDVVRVRSLEGMRADGCGLGSRSPAIGDMGAVVAIVTAAEGDDVPSRDAYLIECVLADGATAWMASFPRDSIELMSRFEEMPR
ncbi:MAG: hypothetical protein KA144_06900 [Xanthomonadaceae bacterium]|nr:hypothetical protein [Xanthomonadaceae bacterium]